MSPRTVRAHAKLNLRLAILAREAKGFHQIETLFALLALADEVQIAPGPEGIRLRVEGAELGAPEDNLVVRAARAWCDATGSTPAFDIRLVKRIPAGAGLGGGSSDAAATLAALDAAADDALGNGRLVHLAAQLGSDVPFFLAGTPFALAWGRGERCLRLTPPPDRPVLLGTADPPVATARAYAAFDAADAAAPPAPLPPAGDLSTWQGIAAAAGNDFERVLLPEMPGARRLIEIFRAHGAAVAALTGSGAAVFGIFADDERLEVARRAARDAIPDAWLCATRTAFRERAG